MFSLFNYNQARLIVLLILFFALPILALLIFIFPWSKIYTLSFDPENQDKIYSVPLPDLDREFSRYAVFNILQNSLNLNWYKLCIENNNIALNNGTIISANELGEQSAATNIDITYSNGIYQKNFLYVKRLERGCKRIDANNGFKYQLTYATPFKFKIPANTDLRKGFKQTIEAEIDTSKSRLYLKNDLVAVFIKDFLLWLAYTSILLHFWKIISLLRNTK